MDTVSGACDAAGRAATRARTGVRKGTRDMGPPGLPSASRLAAIPPGGKAERRKDGKTERRKDGKAEGRKDGRTEGWRMVVWILALLAAVEPAATWAQSPGRPAGPAAESSPHRALRRRAAEGVPPPPPPARSAGSRPSGSPSARSTISSG